MTRDPHIVCADDPQQTPGKRHRHAMCHHSFVALNEDSRTARHTLPKRGGMASETPHDPSQGSGCAEEH